MLRFFAAALMLCASAVSAHAFVCPSVPPVQYDHKPRIPYKLVWWPQARIHAVFNAEAFTALTPQGYTVYLPKDVSPKWKACYLRHELGHVNGWHDPNHAGARRAVM